MTTMAKVKKIDADTHFNLSVDFNDLKELLPRSKVREAEDMMWRDAERWADPQGVRTALTGAPGDGGGFGARRGDGADPSRDPELRLKEMDRLGFDMQVLNTQRALPSPLRPADRPLWLRAALAQLYNNAAADLQRKYPDRFICQITFPWDDIETSVKEVERAAALGLKAVTICGSWMDQNLDAYELYPFWDAVSGLDLACMVHNNTQPCGGTILDHTTSYPMVGTERYHRLHLGTYVGFGIDYTVACAALSLGGVLDEFPNLRFLFFEAGAGWMTYAMYGSDRSFYIERACARTNTPPSELIKAHCYTAVESLEPLEQMVAAYGSENFLIGTDFPHPEFQRLPNATSDITDRPGLTQEDKDNILGGNFARALKL
jgi:predicted TIM-barrel fold metal-dependent hydrolase